MLRIIHQRGCLHKEPRRLDAMTGIDDAASNGVNQVALFVNALQNGLVLGFEQVFLDKRKRRSKLLVEVGSVNNLLQHHHDVEEHHGDGVAETALRGLRREEAWRRQHGARTAEECQRLVGIAAVAARQRIFRHGDDSKALGEDIAALLHRAAFGRHREEHVAIGVETMTLNEVNAALRGR